MFLADLEKENAKYLRKDIDGGILNDKIEIDRYKYQQYCEVVDNLMLGNYNEFGEYIIQDEIKSELLSCTKTIVDNYENLLFIKSKNPINAFGNLNFVVKVVGDDKSDCQSAYLELLEPIYKAKGYIENTQATLIKKVTFQKNDLFKENVYKAFNIVLDNSNLGAETENVDEFKETIERKIRLLYIKKNIDMNADYEICFKKSITELEKTPEGKKAVEQFKKDEKIAQKYLGLKENDYKARTELLAKSAENNKKTAEVVNKNSNVVFRKGAILVNGVVKRMKGIKTEKEKPNVFISIKKIEDTEEEKRIKFEKLNEELEK